MKNRSGLFCLVTLLCAPGCHGNDPHIAVPPTNLQIAATASTDGSGLVTFLAKADNAVSYTFYYGEGANLPETVADGSGNHTYETSGSYNVRVEAISVDHLTADATSTISVNVQEAPIPTTGYATPDNYAGMKLVWQDEFNGSNLNTADWNYETGGDGWGNNELEYYQSSNTSVRDGFLIIKAKKENVGANFYTSSRLTTQNKKTFEYGRVDIRAVLPKGKGIWPALWMLGSSIATVDWPKCGEIDIMEMTGGSTGDNKIYGTSHWDDNGHQSDGGSTTLTNARIFHDDFHVFSVIWNSSSITYYLDDVAFHTTTTTPDALSEFRASFFFIMNVAVGGNFPGNPDNTTVFPQQLVVDYIRVFQ